MEDTYLGYPVKWVPAYRVFYNDDVLYLSAGSLQKNESGWACPDDHPNKKYLHQTGTILRNTHGQDYSAADHLRTRCLYKNLITSIERDGLQAPLVSVCWNNLKDLDWSLPNRWPVWKKFWQEKVKMDYWRVIQGNTRLLVLKDLRWNKIPIIDITEESREILEKGECPCKNWVYSDRGRHSTIAAENVGFRWAAAHTEMIFEGERNE